MEISITPSIIIEYLYCPRFIYFMKVLDIDQNEESRFKVQKGREIHKYKALTNKDYLRKKINVIKKETEQELYSRKYSLHGKVDEILFFENNEAAPLDYKYAEYKDKVFGTYRIQSTAYGLLIKENYGVNVNKGFLVYTRSKNKLIEIEINEKEYDEVKEHINNILEIIDTNFFPKKTRVSSRCMDCCYKNICIH